MNIKEETTANLTELLFSSGFATSLTMKSVAMSNARIWAEKAEKAEKEYLKRVSPFEGHPLYTDYKGTSATFSQHTLPKQSLVIQKLAHQRLKPFIHYPVGSRAAIHLFHSTQGKEEYFLVENLDKVHKFWAALIDELYSRP